MQSTTTGNVDVGEIVATRAQNIMAGNRFLQFELYFFGINSIKVLCGNDGKLNIENKRVNTVENMKEVWLCIRLYRIESMSETLEIINYSFSTVTEVDLEVIVRIH